MVEIVWGGYPRSYTRGRIRPVQLIAIHATHGSEGPLSAENGIAYDKTRTDGTSCHIFVDSDSAVREVPDTDRAHHARYHGNQIALGLEICGRADQTAAQWDDPISRATLRNAADVTAQLCRIHSIPVQRLSVAQTRAAYYAAPSDRPRGIVGHIDITRAFPEDEGTHYDPGPNFPWAMFLDMVRGYLTGDHMPLDTETLEQIKQKIWHSDLDNGERRISAGTSLLSIYDRQAQYHGETVARMQALMEALAASQSELTRALSVLQVAVGELLQRPSGIPTDDQMTAVADEVGNRLEERLSRYRLIIEQADPPSPTGANPPET